MFSFLINVVPVGVNDRLHLGSRKDVNYFLGDLLVASYRHEVVVSGVRLYQFWVPHTQMILPTYDHHSTLSSIVLFTTSWTNKADLI